MGTRPRGTGRGGGSWGDGIGECGGEGGWREEGEVEEENKRKKQLNVWTLCVWSFCFLSKTLDVFFYPNIASKRNVCARGEHRDARSKEPCESESRCKRRTVSWSSLSLFLLDERVPLSVCLCKFSFHTQDSHASTPPLTPCTGHFVHPTASSPRRARHAGVCSVARRQEQQHARPCPFAPSTTPPHPAIERGGRPAHGDD